MGYQISLVDAAVFSNTFSENGVFTALRCCFPVARAHLLIPLYYNLEIKTRGEDHEIIPVHSVY